LLASVFLIAAEICLVSVSFARQKKSVALAIAAFIAIRFLWAALITVAPALVTLENSGKKIGGQETGGGQTGHFL
jgi:hypothetical protein